MAQSEETPTVAVYQSAQKPTGIPFPSLDSTIFTDKWIRYDRNNLYPQWLKDLSASPTHHSLLQYKRDMIAGEGLEWDKANAELTAFFELLESNFKDWSDCQSMEDLIMELAYDLVMFGGFSFWTMWSRDGSTVASLSPLPYESVRLAVPCDDENAPHITGVYVSRNWEQYLRSLNKPCRYPRYSRALGGADPGTPQVFWYMQGGRGACWYPIPDYIGAVNDILADSLISQFRVSAISGGFVPGAILKVKGLRSEDQRKKFEHQFELNFEGPRNTNRPMIIYDEGLSDGDGNVQIEMPKSEGVAALYDSTQKHVLENIHAAHRVHKSLSGMDSGAQLGGEGNVIRSGMMLLEQTVARSYRKPIEMALRRLAKDSGVQGWDSIRIKPFADETTDAAPAPTATTAPTVTARFA